ncbi:MAG: PTS sugar transporter subunit IIA [Sarcina sp.]
MLGKFFGKKDDNKVLKKENILIGLKTPENKYEAIRMAGEMLVKGGYVTEEYIEGMIKREDDLSTYLGFGIAIPHGIGEAKKHVKKTGIVVLQFKDGVPFSDEKANLIVGIAARGEEHLEILANIATLIEEEEEFEKLKVIEDKEYILKAFTKKLN